MSRLARGERNFGRARPKRRAAKTHFFKYQLTGDPSRAEENAIKRALQESLEEQKGKQGSNNTSINSSTNSSDVNKSNTSSSSNESLGSIASASSKRTRSSISSSVNTTPVNKREKLGLTNGHQNNRCDGNTSIVVGRQQIPVKATTTIPHSTNRAIKTYSRTHPHIEAPQQVDRSSNTSPIITNQSPINQTIPPPPQSQPQPQQQQQQQHQTQTPVNKRAKLGLTNGHHRSSPKLDDAEVQNGSQGSGHNNDCSLDDTSDLSKKRNQNQVHVKVTKKRLPQGSWSLLGVPEERIIYLRDDEPPKRLICYPAIKHVEGDVIQVRDSVLLRSGVRKTDLPFIAKVCSFWEDAETGSVMMSLYWYYRPEHTEDGRKPHQLHDEIFASRHRDVDSVECIEDKCYVLTFNEYCRYKKRCKMEQMNTTWSLTDVTVPVSNESYPRRNRIPDSSVNPELVFCCRQIYDSRMKRLVKNPLINPKYGHI